MPVTFKKLLLIGLLCGLLLPLAVHAAEESTATEEPAVVEATTEETTEVPAGLNTLMFLIGAGAVIAVGGLMMARDNFKEEASA